MTESSDDPIAIFETEKRETIASYEDEQDWHQVSKRWMYHAFQKRYMYNFSWLGRPIIQIPTDMVAVAELIWSVKPDLIIEMGIAHGGSLIYNASMLALLDVCDSAESGEPLDPKAIRRKVLGVDIDIRAHNRAAIEAHPMHTRVQMVEGSSLDPEVIHAVKSVAQDYRCVMVLLDSNHTHEHVLAELEAYAPFTTKGSYCLVFDTIVEDLPEDMFPDRPWGVGNNPKTAVRDYLRLLKNEGRSAADGDPLNLVIDQMTEHKLLLTVAPSGYLKRV